MAPVSRSDKKARGSQSRRPATAPAQQRRNAAAQPTRRQAADEDETTPFDAAAVADADDEDEDDEDSNGRYASEDDLPDVIDLSGIEPTTYEVTPKGWYTGYVDEVEYGLSQSKGLPMLTWVLKYDYEDRERTIRWYTTLEGDGAGRTVAALQRLDPELDLATFSPNDADEHFGGMEVRIRITIRPDRDDRKIKRNNVAEVLPLDEDDE